MLYAVVPGNSMQLFFGDPLIDSEQGQLPVGAVREHAIRVAQLVASEPDELFERAVRIGPPARRYAELARLVESVGVTLKWEPTDAEPVELTPSTAEAHVMALTREPDLAEHVMHVHGVLYRVFAERRNDRLGTIGIHLFQWSARPTGHAKLLAAYESPDVGYAIKDGLIGEPVEARLQIREALPGTSIEPGHRMPIVVEIRRGDPDETRFGIDMFADDDDDEIEDA
jgi:hypothetical protein